MAFLTSVDRAVRLLDEAETIAKSLFSAVKEGAADVSADDLEAAKERLSGALTRAQDAHDNLESAIADRLAAGS